jgi:hypothetical protein
MNIQLNEDNTIQAYGVAVKGNLEVPDENLPADFGDNAFWKYRWNGTGFDIIAVMDEDGKITRLNN